MMVSIGRLLLIPLAGMLSTCPLCAQIDLDGDGGSEIWSLMFGGAAADDRDQDGDGQTNFEEMVAGTDPGDREDVFELSCSAGDDGQFVISWAGVKGKYYQLQEWDSDLVDWVQIENFFPQEIGKLLTVRVPSSSRGVIFRGVVSDRDEDGDGLSAWEEALLGWDDSDIRSSGRSGLLDYAAALYVLEDAAGASLENGLALPQRLPSAAEAARFLVQSSFGPTSEAIMELRSSGISRYLDRQLEMPTIRTRASLFRTGIPSSALSWRHAWWRTVLIAPDQLRQRVAYALSQIFVVNNEPGSIIGDNPSTQAEYYDLLVEGAFGAFRGVAESVTYSPTMGFYLSHLNNRKADLPANRFPDENFAREIMQLFTIGLWKLNQDGTRVVGSDGENIPTYDNKVITEMAKVFTGMSNGTTMRGRPATSFFDTATGDDFRLPMIVFDEEHETGEKVIFDNLVIPGGQTGEEDVQLTLDHLCSHANVAPFIGKLLIQRFTSSNPSSAYLERVSSVWMASDGDLGEVVKAILLDPEARTPDRGEGIRGKVREPILRLTHMMRAFAQDDQRGQYGVLAPAVQGQLGQFPMSSPSVFNFYLPNHSPQGLFTERQLFAPELEIATTSTLLSTHDLLKRTVIGHWVRSTDLSDERALSEDPEALVEHLSVLLTFGEMSPVLRAAVLERASAETSPARKVEAAIQTVVTSPDFSVLQ